MDEQTVANRIKSYIPPELRGIPQALRETVTPYIPPELRPYSLAAKQAGDLAVMMNPITMAREMTGKSGQFFDSGGKDYQAGLGALLDTALLSAGPIAGRIAYGAKEPMKAGLRYMQDLFYPLGASDEVAEQAVKIADPSKRDFMKKAGTAGILSVVPAVRGIEEIVPTAKTVEGATAAKAVKASPKMVKKFTEVLSAIKKSDKSFDELEELGKILELEKQDVYRINSNIPFSVSAARRAYDDADTVAMDNLFESQGMADDLFKVTKLERDPYSKEVYRRTVQDEQGNDIFRVLDASEKQAVKEMFENMSGKDLLGIAYKFTGNVHDEFLHPDVLDNFLKQISIPDRFPVDDYFKSSKEVIQEIRENYFVVQDTPIGKDAREVLEKYTGEKIPVETVDQTFNKYRFGDERFE